MQMRNNLWNIFLFFFLIIIRLSKIIFLMALDSNKMCNIISIHGLYIPDTILSTNIYAITYFDD
jgi:hypothetical protein